MASDVLVIPEVRTLPAGAGSDTGDALKEASHRDEMFLGVLPVDAVEATELRDTTPRVEVLESDVVGFDAEFIGESLQQLENTPGWISRSLFRHERPRAFRPGNRRRGPRWACGRRGRRARR
mgnify:FL=1